MRGDATILPEARLDVNQRANLERLMSHLKKNWRYSLWQLGAESPSDSHAYDAFCDYFINKQRVGLLNTQSHAVYLVPPNPDYVKPLDLPDADYLYAFVIENVRNK